MNRREALVRALESKIGRQNLVFVGIRGHDAAPLLALPQFRDCFAVSAPLGASSLITDTTLEQRSQRRYDLDTYDYDLDQTAALAGLRGELLHRLRDECSVLTYRPSHFLWNAGFASNAGTRVLGMYKDKQAAYEYKPWVETEVARLRIPTIPWRYVADEARYLEAADFRGPVVLRASRMAGGVGVALARTPEEVVQLWPAAPDQLVAVGPFLAGALPINVGAVAFSPTRVVLHPGSLQLIGIADATTRPFGYCGNDFGAFGQLDRELIDLIDETTRRIGEWLSREGYRGAFGVDYLWHQGVLYFSEVNPRLQGSTALSSALAGELGLPDIVLDHLAANLGIAPTNDLSLAEWASLLPPTAHIVVHNTHARTLRMVNSQALLSSALRGWELQLVPGSDICVAPGAILVRLVTRSFITQTGYGVTSVAAAAIAAVHEATDKRDAEQQGKTEA